MKQQDLSRFSLISPRNYTFHVKRIPTLCGIHFDAHALNHNQTSSITYLKAFFLSAEFISLPALNYLLGSKIFEEVVTGVSKRAEVWVRSGA